MTKTPSMHEIDRRNLLLLAGSAGLASILPPSAVAQNTPMSIGKIDTHQHFFPKIYVDTVGLDLLAAQMPNKRAPTWSPELAIEMMDANSRTWTMRGSIWHAGLLPDPTCTTCPRKKGSK